MPYMSQESLNWVGKNFRYGTSEAIGITISYFFILLLTKIPLQPEERDIKGVKVPQALDINI